MIKKIINLLQKVDFNEKVKNYKLKKLYKILKLYVKMEKTIIKFGDSKIKNQKFYQYKRPILNRQYRC